MLFNKLVDNERGATPVGEERVHKSPVRFDMHDNREGSILEDHGFRKPSLRSVLPPIGKPWEQSAC